MVHAARTLTLATALLAPLSWVHAGTSVDPSGHWEGAIHAPSGEVSVAVDLARDEGGTLGGTFSNPSEHIKGFPFWNATVDGGAVRLEIKMGEGAQAFVGNLAADGQSLSGDFLVSVYAVPFSLKRTGEARIEPPPRSPAIDDALAGEWSASLDVGGKSLPVTLRLSNEADGTSTGSWGAGGGTPTPVAIEYRERRVTLESTVTPSAYSGSLSADGTEIAGTFKEGALEQPMTFRRAVAR